MKFIVSSFVLLFLQSKVANAQFACTFSATDEPSCLSHKDDDGSNCVWCSLSQFGFCVDEGQAESMEKSVPGVQCERNGPNGNDDAAPETDDGVSPSDDTIPDNYWKCLLQKTADACNAAECTWCKTKAGFGVCMTGPSADAAKESDWFDCEANDLEENQNTENEDSLYVADPYDPMCALSFLQNPTKDGCKAATDSDGNACEFCDLQGMGNLCLNAEQAEMAQQIGVTCDSQKVKAQDPYDPMCALSFLQNPTKDGCKAATDSDGNACEFCDLQGMGNLCLNAEQAEMAQQIGVTCDSSIASIKDEGKAIENPFDPACGLAFLQNPTEKACRTSTDSDGNTCAFCNLEGTPWCFSLEQAKIANSIGITCDDSSSNMTVEEETVEDPYDPMCALSFLQNPTKDGCKAATDSDGNACEFCDIQGMGNLCLNAEQAEMAQQIGVTCDKAVASSLRGAIA
jgi:DNA-binding XRE family transcriptional regulator